MFSEKPLEERLYLAISQSAREAAAKFQDFQTVWEYDDQFWYDYFSQQPGFQFSVCLGPEVLRAYILVWLQEAFKGQAVDADVIANLIIEDYTNSVAASKVNGEAFAQHFQRRWTQDVPLTERQPGVRRLGA